MKTVLGALFALTIMILLPIGSYAANGCCPAVTPPVVTCPSCPSAACPSCPAGGYDRTPVPAQIAGPCGAGPACGFVNPWVGCGAFCTSGQLAAGWPYGWNSQYWLRPDSNF